ncbi:MAG: Resolvase, terminal domain, partial [Deltaproteobacteria bacterium]|nr:Resolvase, terminal domain [Deltaproteobacteria bacterium]
MHRYTDHGISGTRRDRPEYQAMLADAKARKFDVLLLDELSRFS